MPQFSASSIDKLSSCNPALIELFSKVVVGYDCSILEGFRSAERQNHLFEMGRSQLKFPASKHNRYPTRAVDCIKWYSEEPHIRWKDEIGHYHFSGYVLGVAKQLGIDIRWGGDWDSDNVLDDQRFMDLVHFELRDV